MGFAGPIHRSSGRKDGHCDLVNFPHSVIRAGNSFLLSIHVLKLFQFIEGSPDFEGLIFYLDLRA